MVNLSLPPQMKNTEFEEYWTQIDSECKNLGIAIVGGHTGKYVGSDYTIVGGGVMMTLAPEKEYVTSSMGRPGDSLVMTKGTAIATTALLARVFPRTIEKAHGASFLKKAQAYLQKFSAVEDALTAASVGLREKGVTAMHDVTEGGLLGALYELSIASNIGMEIELSDIIVTEEAKLICDLFKLSPYSTLSEGTLIISVKPNVTQKVLKALELKGIRSAIIGKVTEANKGRWIITGKKKERLRKPGFDPYWRLIGKLVRMAGNEDKSEARRSVSRRFIDSSK